MAASLAAAALPAAAAPRRKKSMHSSPALIKPPRLQAGDTVGLIAPAGHTDAPSIEKAVRNIEALGFKVKLGRNLEAVFGNYAGVWQQRLDDFHGMFADPEVKAIWAIRGGSGAMQLLPHLDYGLIRKNPKILVGYSDITALHLAIHRHVGLVTFHGPVAVSTPSDYSMTHLFNVLMRPEEGYVIPMALENSRKAEESPEYAMRTVVPGVATGRLMGGNLCLVSALAGTPYAADYRDCILFLEEVNEAPYRVDRMMMQLDMNRPFSQAAAVMLGIFEKCGPAEGDISLTLDETTDQHLRPLAIPAVTGYSFGHIRNQFTLPMGIRATLDTERQTLTLLETAVS
ncbi:S66 peptidase family protein [Massilia endophytica]|uniref:S66 peptidase family protein n=1 Tax=Massilia endophytica TaxID=2899220 RepID=UPI001E61C82D|nr:LD-carboxypeptidase [Massilia endophytica]UGQ46492.1 LD-carboxypeptidase [Massilia endophytica]